MIEAVHDLLSRNRSGKPGRRERTFEPMALDKSAATTATP
jgi:hypothetical protein